MGRRHRTVAARLVAVVVLSMLRPPSRVIRVSSSRSPGHEWGSRKIGYLNDGFVTVHVVVLESVRGGLSTRFVDQGTHG